MRIKAGFLAPLLAVAALGAAVVSAPVASAVPQCTDVGPTTTLCQTNGSAQLVTSPPATNYSPWMGFPYGGIGIGFFGIGL